MNVLNTVLNVSGNNRILLTNLKNVYFGAKYRCQSKLIRQCKGIMHKRRPKNSSVKVGKKPICVSTV